MTQKSIWGLTPSGDGMKPKTEPESYSEVAVFDSAPLVSVQTGKIGAWVANANVQNALLVTL